MTVMEAPMTDLPSLRAALQTMFSDHVLEEDTNEDKVTIALRKGWVSGVEIELEAGKATVEWDTKIGTVVILATLGCTFVLMMLFGETMLQAMGLIAETGDGGGFTLKLFYIIPMLIFLVPLMIVGSIAKGKIAPVQEGLLARAREAVTSHGYVLEEE